MRKGMSEGEDVMDGATLPSVPPSIDVSTTTTTTTSNDYPIVSVRERIKLMQDAQDRRKPSKPLPMMQQGLKQEKTTDDDDDDGVMMNKRETRTETTKNVR